LLRSPPLSTSWLLHWPFMVKQQAQQWTESEWL
jgi:hypothetical protein